MKAKIHPKWYEEAKVTCACGKTFTVGATVAEIQVEVCSACHPFYTGKMKYVDSAGRVDAFLSKQKKAKSKVISKTQKREIKKAKRIQKELDKPESLEELRKEGKKKTKKRKD